ncbi:putative UDP-glucosyltransferase [Tripterygium wilfordii]|uniref:Putative UDP-glucosyltransferase n=1 Tax=Tripterygium wilfordii TaxID=458696 RepID=A0A7J7C1N2_TRIWF|nr:UDP-glycosyltransferase 79B6-like [Tripterygium wilfordii]KAF5728044.1 putative UDP-glucosyltransferase [Tripterygium wilfordii]
MAKTNFHIVMFPWLAIGHMTPFLHLSNKLAERGHRISFLLPNKAIQQLQHFNHYPNLITFHSLTIPHVDGLPIGTETASDIPLSLNDLLSIAFDRTRPQFEETVNTTRPDFVFYDSAHWIPEVTKQLGIKTINYNVVCAASIAIALVPARNVVKGRLMSEAELAELPVGYPSSNIVLHGKEWNALTFISFPFGENITFYDRITTAIKGCDAIAIRTCSEIEGNMCDYIGNQYGKPVFLTGPVLPEPAEEKLDEKWEDCLSGFEQGSVLFCAFGSQYILEKDQFQELVLGFELSGLPFLIALKPPMGVSTIEQALPEGFEERVKGRGVVWGGWVQQPLILAHKSVGCFVNHCGFGSMWESLMSNCQIVLIPHLGDQILNTRIMAGELKVAVEVEREENGWFTKESVCQAIKSVMDKDSEVGALVKKNHEKWSEKLVTPGLMSGYIDKFVENMKELVR